MIRNKHLISSKKVVKFDTSMQNGSFSLAGKKFMMSCPPLWLQLGWICMMHLCCGVRQEILLPKTNAVGCESQFELILPSWLVFVVGEGVVYPMVPECLIKGKMYHVFAAAPKMAV